MSTNQNNRPDEKHFYPKSKPPIFEEIWIKDLCHLAARIPMCQPDPIQSANGIT
jgi:hypothetical protein